MNNDFELSVSELEEKLGIENITMIRRIDGYTFVDVYDSKNEYIFNSFKEDFKNKVMLLYNYVNWYWYLENGNADLDDNNETKLYTCYLCASDDILGLFCSGIIDKKRKEVVMRYMISEDVIEIN